MLVRAAQVFHVDRKRRLARRATLVRGADGGAHDRGVVVRGDLDAVSDGLLLGGIPLSLPELDGEAVAEDLEARGPRDEPRRSARDDRRRDPTGGNEEVSSRARSREDRRHRRPKWTWRIATRSKQASVTLRMTRKTRRSLGAFAAWRLSPSSIGATTPNERGGPRVTARSPPSRLLRAARYGAGLTAGVAAVAGVVAAGAVDVPVTVFFWVDPRV